MLRRMLALVTTPLVAIFLLVGPSAGELDAQAAFGPEAHFGSEGDFGIGGRALINIPDVDLEAVGNVVIFFPSGFDWFEVNANVFYHFHLDEEPSLIPYVGGGLNIARLSFDAPDDPFFNGGSFSTTEVGLNIGGGVRFPGGGNITPFLEARAVISDADQLVVGGGVLFGPTRFVR